MTAGMTRAEARAVMVQHILHLGLDADELEHQNRDVFAYLPLAEWDAIFVRLCEMSAPLDQAIVDEAVEVLSDGSRQ